MACKSEWSIFLHKLIYQIPSSRAKEEWSTERCKYPEAIHPGSKRRARSVLMRCFVPVTAAATREIFRISIGGWLLPGNRSQSGQHREKKDIFLFIILHYPFGSGSVGSNRRGERWQAGWRWNMGHVVRLETTSLDGESTPRRPYNTALTASPSEKGPP